MMIKYLFNGAIHGHNRLYAAAAKITIKNLKKFSDYFHLYVVESGQLF